MKRPKRTFPSFRLPALLSLLLLLPVGDVGGLTRPSRGRAGDTVFYGVTDPIRSLDPIASGDIASAMITGLLYEGLLRYDYLDRPYRVEPLIAEALPERDEAGTTYTFRLREGVFFHDDPCFPGGRGREVVASDFRYSILRLADPRSETTGFWVIRGRLEGIEEFRQRVREQGDLAYAGHVPGIEVLDPRTLRFRLTEPYPQFLWVLTMHYLSVVPPEAIEVYGADFQRHPVGTGPFELVGWRRNYRIELHRNQQWRSRGGGASSISAARDEGRWDATSIDRVIRYVVQDESTAWLMFLTGGLDLTALTTDQFDAVASMGGISPELEARGVLLDKVPALQTIYIGFGMDDPVVGENPLLRRALSCALDRERLIAQKSGKEVEAVSPIPPAIPGGIGAPNPYGYDPGLARRLLAQAGYPDGICEETGRRLELTLDLAGQGQPELRQRVELMAGMLRQVGVQLKPRYQLAPSFFERLDRRDSQMFYLLWSADYPDAENFLQLFYGPNASPGPNHANYANPKYDRLFEKARVLPDGDRRTELYRQLVRIVLEDCPWILVTHPLIYQLRHGWLENYVPHDFPYGNELYYRIDRERRQRMREQFRQQPLRRAGAGGEGD